MTVYQVAGADHRRVGSVLLLPDAIAHYRDGWRTLLIVRIRHQPADPRMHAKGPEETAGHELAITSIGLRVGSRPADAERGIPGL